MAASPEWRDNALDDTATDNSLTALFHRVNSLLPDEQGIVSVPPDAPANEALAIMEAHGFSQLPVMQGDAVIGVFSYRSFAKRIGQLGSADVSRLEVDDCIENPDFVRVTDEMEEIFESLDRDGAVLVGDPDHLIAVATPTDLIRYLYHVTHPFVLIQEIELVLRALVTRAASPDQLDCFIRRAISSKYQGRMDDLPTALDNLDLGELVLTVVHGDNYRDVFYAVLGRNRESTRGYLGPVPRLRNEVFHFRRRITGEDYQTLANTRTWLLRKARTAEARGGPRHV